MFSVKVTTYNIIFWNYNKNAKYIQEEIVESLTKIHGLKLCLTGESQRKNNTKRRLLCPVPPAVCASSQFQRNLPSLPSEAFITAQKQREETAAEV